MSAAQPHPTPGQQALAEAARLEAALVYGRVHAEARSEPEPPPVSVFAVLAEAELEAALERQRQAAEPVVDEPLRVVENPAEPVRDAVHGHLAAALRLGLTNRQAMDEYGVGYATVRAARAAS